MKKFSQEEIEETRRYFRHQGYWEVDVSLGSRSFSYFILPQSLEPSLPNFVLRMTGTQSDGYVLGISDQVREVHRPYAVAHEYIEFFEIGIKAPDRCVRALNEELALVPAGIRSSYVEMRRNFFRNLIEYCSARPGHFTEQDIEEFRKSLQRLEQELGTS